MLKKLFQLTSINTVVSLMNFLITIFVISFFGIEIFGEFTIFMTYTSFLLLIYVLIPPYYSVVQLQKYKKFINILFSIYIILNIINMFIVIIIYSFVNIEVNIFLIILYIITQSWLQFIDIVSQAYDHLINYFKTLFFVSALKLLFLFIIYLYNIKATLDLLVLIHVSSQLIAISIYIWKFNSTKIKFTKVSKIIWFIIKELNSFKKYYINNILKRVLDSLPIVILSYIISSEIIGIYTLFTKVGNFVLGQARILEAFFMNINNLNKSYIITNKIFYISFVLQMLILIIGAIYFQLSIGKVYFKELILYSFIVYPYIIKIFKRNLLYHQLNIKIINYAILISIFSIITCYTICLYFKINILYIAILSLVISETLSSIFFNIYFTMENKNEKIN